MALLHLTVDGEDEAHRRAEKFPVAGKEFEPGRLVFARDAHGRIHRLADPKAPRLVGLGQFGRIDVIFGPLAHQMLFARLGDAAHEFVARRPQKRIHFPGLEIAARRRARRERKDALDRFARHRIGPERADRLARGDGFTDFHKGVP